MSSTPDDGQVAAAPPGDGAAWPPPVPGTPLPPPDPAPAARRPWSAWGEIRGDLRSSAAVLAVLALAGFPVGLLWWWLAPRADFRITADGPVAVGQPSDELLAGDDVVFALLVAGVGVLAGVLAWSLLRRRRGVATLVAIGLGSAACAGIGWQLGELLGPAPTHAQLAAVGATVTTGLSLRSPAALAVGPFFAVLSYLVAAAVTRRDDLGRPAAQPAVGLELAPVPLGQ
jgi:hypothetical protein